MHCTAASVSAIAVLLVLMLSYSEINWSLIDELYVPCRPISAAAVDAAVAAFFSVAHL